MASADGRGTTGFSRITTVGTAEAFYAGKIPAGEVHKDGTDRIRFFQEIFGMHESPAEAVKPAEGSQADPKRGEHDDPEKG